MKRFLAICLIVVLCAAMLCACGKKNDPAPTAATAATEAPTVAATTAPTAASEAPLPTQSGPMVDASWFNDAVFVGDSITTTLDMFSADEPELFVGDAHFVCADCLGYHNAMWDLNDENAVHPVYQGQTVLAETAAQITGANKMFILMGINDIGTYGAEDTMDAVKEWVGRILVYSPDVELYFQSTTPIITPKESDYLNNKMIIDFNTMLQAYCSENGYHYLDVYHAMCDETGALRAEWCDDPDEEGIHFNYRGCIAWANYLRSAIAASTGAVAATEAPAADPAATTNPYATEADDDDDYDDDDYDYEEDYNESYLGY